MAWRAKIANMTNRSTLVSVIADEVSTSPPLPPPAPDRTNTRAWLVESGSVCTGGEATRASWGGGRDRKFPAETDARVKNNLISLA